MVTLPSWISSHRTDHVRATFWLAKIGLTTPLYLTDCDQPIVYDSNVYVPSVMQVEGVQADAGSAGGSGGRLSLASGGAHWQPILAEISGGKRDFEVTLWEAWLDVATLPSPVPPANAVRLVAKTRVEAAEWDRAMAVFTLGPSEDPALARIPFREYSDLCTYRRFKGAQCGYAGAATTCDRTLSTCTGLGNSARFGGGFTLYPDGKTATWRWQTGGVDYTGSVTFTSRER